MMRTLVLGLAIVATLVACGGGGGDSGGGGGGGTAADVSNAGLRERLNTCGMAINYQNGDIGNLSACLIGKYNGTILFTSTPCSAELTSDGKVHFTVDGSTRTFQRPFVSEGYTKKTMPVGQAGSGYSTTGYSIDWRADGTDGTELQSLVIDFNNDLHDGLQLLHAYGSTVQTCFLTVP